MGCDKDDITLDTAYGEYSQWDSLMHLILIMQLEERCNISIPILLEDKNNNLNIYDGNIYKTLNFSNEYSFYRIQ